MNLNYDNLEPTPDQRYDAMEETPENSLLDELSDPALYARTCRHF